MLATYVLTQISFHIGPRLSRGDYLALLVLDALHWPNRAQT